MKKTNRLAAALLTVAISTILVALIRANPTNQSIDLGLQSHQTTITDQGIWAPQKVWLQLTTDGQNISLYILDQNGITQWTEHNTIAPILAFENHSQTSQKFQIPTRNTYAVLIQNPTDTNTRVNLILIFHDPETDLTTAAAVTFIIAISIPAANQIKKHIKNKNAT